MAALAPPFVTGVWVGQAVDSTSGEMCPLLWNFTLADDPTQFVPSAFGASLTTRPPPSSSEAVAGAAAVAGAGDGSLVRILDGTWEKGSMSLEIRELSAEPGMEADLMYFRAQLSLEADGALSIKGTYTRGSAEAVVSRGVFGVRRESDEDPESKNDSALYIGNARPDASLAPFAIPTNPVYCSITFLRNPAEGAGVSAFGVGYLNDAADVPGKPLLFYTLHGTHDPAAKSFRLAKRYQYEAETDGYEVIYEGTLTDVQEDGFVHMEGSWENPKGGSFGSLACRRLQPTIPPVIMRLAVTSSLLASAAKSK